MVLARRIPAQVIQMSFQCIDVCGPKLTELCQPRVHLAQGLRFQPIQTSLRIDCGFNEARVPQYTQVLRDSGLIDLKPTLNLPHGLLRSREEAEDGTAVRLGENFKR